MLFKPRLLAISGIFLPLIAEPQGSFLQALIVSRLLQHHTFPLGGSDTPLHGSLLLELPVSLVIFLFWIGKITLKIDARNERILNMPAVYAKKPRRLTVARFRKGSVIYLASRSVHSHTLGAVTAEYPALIRGA